MVNGVSKPTYNWGAPSCSPVKLPEGRLYSAGLRSKYDWQMADLLQQTRGYVKLPEGNLGGGWLNY